MTDNDASGAPVAPPFIYMGFLAAGLGLDFLFPLPLLPLGLQLGLGGAVIIASFAVAALGFRSFSRSGTTVDVQKPATEIISTGIFAYSRNPLYLSLALLVMGIAIAADSPWGLLAAFLAAGTIRIFVIRREEAYLEGKFGDEYRAYKAKVRRWI